MFNKRKQRKERERLLKLSKVNFLLATLEVSDKNSYNWFKAKSLLRELLMEDD